MTRLRLFALVTCLVFALSAFGQQPGAPWPRCRQNNAGTSMALGYGCDGTIRWKSLAGDARNTVIAADGTVYVFGDMLYAFSSTGTKKWVYGGSFQDTTSGLALGPDGTIYFGQTDDYLYAVNPDGTLKWKFDANGEIQSCAAIGSDGTIYVGCLNGYMYAVNPDGTVKWTFATHGQIRSDVSLGSDGTVYFSSVDSKFYAVTSAGRLKWSYSNASVSLFSAASVGSDGTLYTGGNDGNLYALNPANGALDWSCSLVEAGAPDNSINFSPAIAADGTLIAATNSGLLFGVSPAGAIKWSLVLGGVPSGPPILDPSGRGLIGMNFFDSFAAHPTSADLYSFGIDGSRGFVLECGNWLASMAMGSDGVLYAGCLDGYLYAIGSQSNSFPVQTLSIYPASVAGGTSAVGTVTLSKAAVSAGDVVALSSSNPLVQTPSYVIVPAGAATVTFPLTTSAVTGNVSVTITASSGNTVVNAALTLTPTGLRSITLSPSSVVGGGAVTGTILLADPAPSGGVSVSLSATGGAVVPSSVTIAAGALSANFPITTSPVTATTTATISAGLYGVTVTSSLSIQATALSGFTVSSATPVGGTTVTGTVSLNGPAPITGALVKVSASNSLVTVPNTVTVLPGNSSATFSIVTKIVSTPCNVSIKAQLGSVVQTTSLALQPVRLSTVSVSPSSAIGGSSAVVTGSLSLNSLAASPGDTVTLRSSNPGWVSVPASVRVATGAATASFTVTHRMVTSSQTVTITATYKGVSQTTTLSLTPFSVTGLSLTPSTVAGGASVAGMVTLNATPGRANGPVLVKLKSSSRAVTVPGSVSVAVGASSASFTARTTAVSGTTTATVTATVGLSAKQSTVTVQAPSLVSVTVSVSTVVGSSSKSVTGTVTLSGAAPAGGLRVALTSSNGAATVPASVTIPAGRMSASFAIRHKKVTSAQSVTITASLAGTSKTAALTVTP